MTPAPRPQSALFDLLCELFDSRELVRFATHTFGHDLVRDMPDQGSLGDIAFAFVGLLDRRGLAHSGLFDALARAAPDKSPRIAAVAALWNVDPPAAPSSPAAASRPRADADLPAAVEAAAIPQGWHAFISYAQADAAWVRMLAANLHRLGLDVFFDEWDVTAGAVVSVRLDEGLRASRTGVLVISQASVARPWVIEEYAVLLRNAVERGQRLIPVLLEHAELPPMLANRLGVDFRGKRGQDYLDAVHELAAAIRGQRPQRPARDSPLESP